MGTAHNLTLNGKKLGRLTAQRGLLRGELREQVGVSSVTIAKAFSGRPVGVVTARSIAKVLKVPLADLLIDEAAEAVA